MRSWGHSVTKRRDPPKEAASKRGHTPRAVPPSDGRIPGQVWHPSQQRRVYLQDTVTLGWLSPQGECHHHLSDVCHLARHTTRRVCSEGHVTTPGRCTPKEAGAQGWHHPSEGVTACREGVPRAQRHQRRLSPPGRCMARCAQRTVPPEGDVPCGRCCSKGLSPQASV